MDTVEKDQPQLLGQSPCGLQPSGGRNPTGATLCGFCVSLFREFNRTMQMIYETVEGREGLLALAGAWHKRVLED